LWGLPKDTLQDCSLQLSEQDLTDYRMGRILPGTITNGSLPGVIMRAGAGCSGTNCLNHDSQDERICMMRLAGKNF